MGTIRTYAAIALALALGCAAALAAASPADRMNFQGVLRDSETGLQLESAATGEVSRVLLAKDAELLERRLAEQEHALEALRTQIQALQEQAVP